ncbi:uncharacterized protein A4U43_C10F12330 [Asparagus officinalis]|uniref:Uncharacterized protein n=1 Tax=Asparagus officinalis TaxID=4686 RepID=A0A5P1E5I9_ASPOF|nr:uncharacterized protein A4U43_C10F12330 [Asparagus officinalis]
MRHWTLDKVGNFSTKSSWNSIHSHLPVVQILGDIWSSVVPAAAKVICWKIFHNILPVDARAQDCGVSIASKCFYSASFTDDLSQVVDHVSARYTKSNIYAVGWSLGANILVRFLGQESRKHALSGAVSLCNPFNLVIADEDFRKGFNNVYDKALARSLRRIFKKHALLFEGLDGEYNIPMAANARTVREFDEGLTRVSFAFTSVDDYYFNASSSRTIEHVRTPLLCIQAANDPIAPARGIPHAEIKENPHCLLIVTPQGGHLGWVSGDEAPFGAPWTDAVVMEFLEHIHEGHDLVRFFDESKMTSSQSISRGQSEGHSRSKYPSGVAVALSMPLILEGMTVSQSGATTALVRYHTAGRLHNLGELWVLGVPRAQDVAWRTSPASPELRLPFLPSSHLRVSGCGFYARGTLTLSSLGGSGLGAVASSSHDPVSFGTRCVAVRSRGSATNNLVLLMIDIKETEIVQAKVAWEVRTSSAAQRDATSQPLVEIPAPQTEGEDAAIVQDQEANIIIIGDRSPTREVGIDIHLAKAKETEALIEGEVAPDTPAELAH